MHITSPDNKLFKLWSSLKASWGIEKHGLALVSGRKIVPELVAERGGAGATLLSVEGAPHPSPQAGRGWSEGPDGGIGSAALSRPLFEELDEFGTGAPLLVLRAPRIEVYTEDSDAGRAGDGLVVGVAAQDPSNLGAILRSALAFDAAAVVLLAESAHPFLPRVTRAAAGANFRLRMMRGPSIRALGAEWTALDMAGAPLAAHKFARACRLLLGEEGLGVPEGFAGPRVAIPISPRAESLNVAVAAGIALAAYRAQHPLV